MEGYESNTTLFSQNPSPGFLPGTSHVWTMRWQRLEGLHTVRGRFDQPWFCKKKTTFVILAGWCGVQREGPDVGTLAYRWSNKWISLNASDFFSWSCEFNLTFYPRNFLFERIFASIDSLGCSDLYAEIRVSTRPPVSGCWSRLLSVRPGNGGRDTQLRLCHLCRPLCFVLCFCIHVFGVVRNWNIQIKATYIAIITLEFCEKNKVKTPPRVSMVRWPLTYFSVWLFLMRPNLVFVSMPCKPRYNPPWPFGSWAIRRVVVGEGGFFIQEDGFESSHFSMNNIMTMWNSTIFLETRWFLRKESLVSTISGFYFQGCGTILEGPEVKPWSLETEVFGDDVMNRMIWALLHQKLWKAQTFASWWNFFKFHRSGFGLQIL